jgi:hypothetical protein
MTNLKGFLWSMGRCATKAVSDMITQTTNAHATSWVDTPRILEAPRYFMRAYPDPFVLTLHHPQLCEAFAALVGAHRDQPVVFTVRDPIANLESYAKTFLTSFIARRVEEAQKIVQQGGSIVAAINTQALDQWVMPTANLWLQYNALKDSPHLIVDFSELGEAQFVQTMTRICDFLALERKAPIGWTSESNTDCDRFLIGYLRRFTLMDRALDLRFTRWDNYWGEFGLVTLATLKSPVLEPMLGPDMPLYIQVKADQLLTEGRHAAERAGFAQLLAEPGVSEAIATQVMSDYQKTSALVERELPTLQDKLVRQFMKTYRDGARRLLKAEPALEPHWDRFQAVLAKQAA